MSGWITGGWGSGCWSRRASTGCTTRRSRPGAHGQNYAVLLPVWDWVFGTGDFRRGVFPPTGAPEEPESLASGGWLRQQVVGLRRMVGAIAGR